MMSDVNAPTQGAVPPQLGASITAVNTCTAISSAPFATPGNGRLGSLLPPAAMPATCVPCSQLGNVHGVAAPAPICSFAPLGQNDWLIPGWLVE